MPKWTFDISFTFITINLVYTNALRMASYQGKNVAILASTTLTTQVKVTLSASIKMICFRDSPFAIVTCVHRLYRTVRLECHYVSHLTRKLMILLLLLKTWHAVYKLLLLLLVEHPIILLLRSSKLVNFLDYFLILLLKFCHLLK